MNWTIVPARGGFQVRDCDSIIGTILVDGKRWRVHFMHQAELDFGWDNLEICIGYVRGIERVHALSKVLR
jgi:hypothetical protein